MKKDQPYLISTELIGRPLSFSLYPLSNSNSGNSTRLSDNNITVLVSFFVGVQNILRYLCSFTAPCFSLNDSDRVWFYGLQDLEIKDKEFQNCFSWQHSYYNLITAHNIHESFQDLTVSVALTHSVNFSVLQ